MYIYCKVLYISQFFHSYQYYVVFFDTLYTLCYSVFMRIEEALTELDLTPREAQVYTALLALGEGTPVTLAKKTGLKRTTIYLDLESLRKKQLVGLTPKGKKTVYSPDPPSKLLQRVQQQERAVQELLPYLRALENKEGPKPLIRYYDNLKEIERVWIDECYQAAENYYISDYSNTLELFPELEKTAVKQMNKGVIKMMKEIHPDTPSSRAICAGYPVHSGRAFRFLPKTLQFGIDISIWNDSVALFSNPKRYMLVITDAAITQGFRSMFEASWMVSSVVEKVVITQKRK